MLKAVIFDLNGVFLQSEWLSKRIEERYNIKSVDFTPALKQVMEVVRKPNAPDAFSLWKVHFDKWGLNLNEQEFYDFWFSGEKLVPELVNYVQELKEKGYKIFILSNNFRERTEYYRQQFPDLFNMFDGSYFSWETGFVKPEVEAYMNILKENNLNPDECIYFDDSEKNIEIARDVIGMRSEIYKDLETTKRIIENSPTVVKERSV